MAVKIIECPRDAMQGIKENIPTEKKIRLIRSLMQCGFDTLDMGSFVSPAAVPQMADTAEVLQEISAEKGKNKFLVIVGNERGAHDAVRFDAVDYLGFPLSVNETFQQRNTHAGIEDAFERLQHIHNTAREHGKQTVAYLSMAFGNPYGEPYDREAVIYWAEKVAGLGIEIISLADTVGSAVLEDIIYLFGQLNRRLPQVELGAHFHSLPGRWMPKIQAAWEQGCRRYDGAILGFGGCPMAADDLTGNLPTEGLVAWLNEVEATGINMPALQESVWLAPSVYGH